MHELGRHHLDRDLAVQRDLVGQVDRGHAALPDLLDDLVLAQRRLTEDLEQGGKWRRMLAGHTQPAGRTEPDSVFERSVAAEASGGHRHWGWLRTAYSSCGHKQRRRWAADLSSGPTRDYPSPVRAPTPSDPQPIIATLRTGGF